MKTNNPPLVCAAELLGAPSLDETQLALARGLFKEMAQACEELPSENEIERVFSSEKRRQMQQQAKRGWIALQAVHKKGRSLPQGWACAVMTQGRPPVWLDPQHPYDTQALRALNGSLQEHWSALCRSRWVFCMESQFMRETPAGLRAWKDAVHTMGVHLWDGDQSLLHHWASTASDRLLCTDLIESQKRHSAATAILQAWTAAGGDVNIGNWGHGHSPLCVVLVEASSPNDFEAVALSLIAATPNALSTHIPKDELSMIGLALSTESLTPAIALALERQQTFLFKPLRLIDDHQGRCPMATLLERTNEHPMSLVEVKSLMDCALNEKPASKRVASARVLAQSIRQRHGQIHGPSDRVVEVVEATFAKIEKEVLLKAMPRTSLSPDLGPQSTTTLPKKKNRL